MSKRKASLKAIQLLGRFGRGSTPPIDVERLARELGIDIVAHPGLQMQGEEASGILLRREGRTICIVNKDHSTTRRRFTLAHELGHFILHPPREAYVDARARNERSTRGTDLEEIQANTFAAELLMPAKLVREQVGEGALDLMLDAGRLGDLAKLFQVSPEAMTYRLVNLDLLKS